MKDNLETQNKLWKIWLQKFDNNKEIAKAEKPSYEDLKKDINDEALLVEEEDENDDDDIELIYQHYLKKHKQSGPQANVVTENSKNCTKCEFRAESTLELKDHMTIA